MGRYNGYVSAQPTGAAGRARLSQKTTVACCRPGKYSLSRNREIPLDVSDKNNGNDKAVDLFVRSFPCSQQGRQRALPLFFPPAAIIGSGRCQYRPRPLPTEKAWSFSLSGVPWSQFVATFFLSSLLLWESERSFELYRQVRPRINRSTAISLPCSIPATELSLRQTRTQR